MLRELLVVSLIFLFAIVEVGIGCLAVRIWGQGRPGMWAFVYLGSMTCLGAALVALSFVVVP